MKSIWIVFVLLFAAAQSSLAQAKTKKSSAKKVEVKKKAGNEKSVSKNKMTLNSAGNYQAKASAVSPAEVNQLTVSDPFINVLNAKARGLEPGIKNVNLFGMPKGAYGFANGRLRVFPTGTTSSGTITGMGAVGTGSSPGAIGSTGLGMGANGKSPYAGTGMWGNAKGLMINYGDSSVRRIRH